MVDFSLSHSEQEIRDRARAFVLDECRPLEKEWPLSDYDADPALVRSTRIASPTWASGTWRSRRTQEEAGTAPSPSAWRSRSSNRPPCCGQHADLVRAS